MHRIIAILFCMSVLLVSPSNGSAKPTSGEMKDLKRQVDSAFTVLEEYGEKARLGRMSLEKAQELAKKEISELRYDNDDYFFIFDVNLKMVVHPFMPELVGKDMSSWKDPAGKYLFRDFRSVAIEKGEGFSTHYWPKPGLSYPVEKYENSNGRDSAKSRRAMGTSRDCRIASPIWCEGIELNPKGSLRPDLNIDI